MFGLGERLDKSGWFGKSLMWIERAEKASWGQRRRDLNRVVKSMQDLPGQQFPKCEQHQHYVETDQKYKFQPVLNHTLQLRGLAVGSNRTYGDSDAHSSLRITDLYCCFSKFEILILMKQEIIVRGTCAALKWNHYRESYFSFLMFLAF